MADLASSAEQRCLKLVSMAETAAKEEKKKLMAEIRHLERQLEDREALCTGELDAWDERLHATTAAMSEQSQLFHQKNVDTLGLLETLAARRSEAEGRVISEVKELLSWFHRFQQFDKKRRVQSGFFALQGGPLTAAAATSSADENRGSTHQAMIETHTRGCVSFHDFLNYVDRRNVAAASGGGSGSGVGGNALTEKLRNVMTAAYDDGTMGTNAADDETAKQLAAWKPTPKERRLIDGVLATPLLLRFRISRRNRRHGSPILYAVCYSLPLRRGGASRILLGSHRTAR